MTVRQLGEACGIAFETINKYENGRPMRESNKDKLLAVFDTHGVEILNGDAPGARMKPGVGKSVRSGG